MEIDNMFSFKRSIFLLSAVAFQAFAAAAGAVTELSGTVDSMTISAEGNPFLVKGTLTIPHGGRLVVKKGCQLFFRPSTGLIVEGSIAIEGTSDEPVIFTSNNDSFSPEKTDQKANPFDWNGIVVTERTKSVVVRHFFIKYSIYGIESHNPNMVLDNGIFIGNGQFNCTVGNRILPIVENIAYSYKNEKLVNAPRRINLDMTNLLLPSAKAATAVGVAAFGLMAYYLHQKGEYADLYHAAITQAGRRDYYERQKTPARNAILCGITGGLWLSAGGTLFALDHRRKNQKTLSLRPVVGEENGILASISF
jgi:hypothetical protein